MENGFLKIPGVEGHSVHLFTDKTARNAFVSNVLDDFGGKSGLDNFPGCLEDFFGDCLIPPKGGILKPVEVEELLNIIQHKFRLISAITYIKELEIYLINKTHISCDSFLLTYKKGASAERLMLFSLSPCMDILECNRYFVFMHEVGHILYNAVTENSAGLPEYFGEIIFLLGLPKTETEGKPDELFADIFAAAALFNTAYSDHNPFKALLSDNIYEFLELYFRMLTYKLEGKLSENCAKSSFIN